MRTYLLFALLILSSKLIYSQHVSIETAGQIAENILAEYKSIPVENISFSETIRSDSSGEQPFWYIFNHNTGGFVMISADERTYPILAFSETGSIPHDEESWSPAFKELIENYNLQIEHIIRNQLSKSNETTLLWEKLLEGKPVGFHSAKNISPLLATTWNQGCGYNALCPPDPAGPCGKVYAGCVATAMAQVMRHLEHPVTGTGSHCYTHSVYGELCADFENTVYDYDAMPNNSSNTAVAELIYHCGVSVNMMYSPSGSGAYSFSVVNAWRNFFDYTNMLLVGKNNYSEAAWDRILKNELENDRPMYYAGYGSGGHAFVIDGFQNTNHYHVNWGWGGYLDGYFYLSALNPGGMNFTNNQQAIVGLIPKGLFTGLDVSSSIELPCGTPLPADISTGTDYVNYYKNTWPAAVGKELVYHFTISNQGRVRIKISDNAGGNVNTFLLSHPHPDSLITHGTNGFIRDNMEPGTYYLAVEGVNGAEPQFTIELICPTADADLIIENIQSSHQFIESETPNVTFSSKVRNIGSTAADACSIEYFLSENDQFDFGTDIFLGSDIVSALNPGEHTDISTTLNIPAGLTPGNYYIAFVVDRLNEVPESDPDNFGFSMMMVPAYGEMDCNSAIALEDGVWHWGNTLNDGVNHIENYWSGINMTGPEVIHSFISPYSGIANVTYVKKSPGRMPAFLLPLCNEFTYKSSFWMQQIYDTIVSQEVHIYGGVEYFIVVDGENGAYGDYGILVELPEQCPQLIIQHSGTINLCEGQHLPSLWTSYGYNNYTWYKDGEVIPGQTSSWFSPQTVGTYHVEVDENGCTGASEPLTIAMDFYPDTAHIISTGPTEFCFGESVELQIEASVPYDINWARNGEPIEGANSDSFTATESGIYSLKISNGACSIGSQNTIEVIAKQLPANIGEPLPLPGENIEFYYTFDKDNSDQSGNNNSFICWDFQPANDRHENFWQARYFTPGNIRGYSSHRYDIPEAFTLTLWFKTTTNEGGFIAGFVNNPWNASTADAFLYMSNDGRIHFYLSNSGTPAELSSSNSYNDGQWHSVLIQHNGGMLMDINKGTELLQNTNNVSKANFMGYWNFAGATLPASVSSMPTSHYFDGYLDDLLCFNEAIPFLNQYNDTPKLLHLEMQTSPIVCNSEHVTFQINPSQYGIEYKVWNNTASEWYLPSATGNGEAIIIGGENAITESTEFLIYAINNETGCETLLDIDFTVEVHPAEEPEILIVSDASVNVCEGTVIVFDAQVTGAGENPLYQWYLNDVLQTENTASFIYNATEGPSEVYAVVISDNPCALSPDATSNTIQHNVHALPYVALDDDMEICAGEEIILTATYENGILSWDNDVVNGEPFIPEETTTYTATVNSEYGCGSVSEQISVHVHPLPVLNAGEDQDACLGEEVTLTATWENGELHWNYDVINGVPFIPTETQTYIATVESEHGCGIITGEVLVTVHPLPEVFITESEHEEGYLLDAGDGFTNYLWSPGGETTQSIIVNESGTYEVFVTDFNGCNGYDMTEVTITGLNIPGISHLKVYPNPVKDFLFIESERDFSVELISINGHLIFRKNSIENNRLDMNSIIPGLYLLRILKSDRLPEVILIIKQ
jgi:hypothetical protein